MATIKSYTDLDQSKKLAEILPIESADCYWEDEISVEFGHGWHSQHVPCWSLAALLSVLPNYELNNFGYYIQLDVKNKALATEGNETLLDLVVNMIILLNELEML